MATKGGDVLISTNNKGSQVVASAEKPATSKGGKTIRGGDLRGGK